MSEQQRQFEQLLLAQVPLCYSVALRLTNSREEARAITRDVLSRAWELVDQPDVHRSIKPRLLSMVRKRVLTKELEQPVALAFAAPCGSAMRLAAKR